jgi:hypothetical protein
LHITLKLIKVIQFLLLHDLIFAHLFLLSQNPLLLLEHHLICRIVTQHVSALLHPFEFTLRHVVDIINVNVSSLAFSVLAQDDTLVNLADSQSIICIGIIHKLVEHVLVISANLVPVVINNETFQIFV